MSNWKMYRQKRITELRPYTPGEDLSDIKVSVLDTLEEGGMIARNPSNPKDQWYVNKQYFQKHLIEVLETEKTFSSDLKTAQAEVGGTEVKAFSDELKTRQENNLKLQPTNRIVE